MPSHGDPLVAITHSLHTFRARGHQADGAGAERAPAAGEQAGQGASEGEGEDEGGIDGIDGIDGGGGGEGEDEGGAALLKVSAAAAAAGGPAGLRPHRRAALPAAADQETLVFLLHPAAARGQAEAAERSAGPAGAPARVLLFGSEAALLATAVEVLRRADPDVIAVFQVGAGCWVGGGVGG